MLESEPPLSPTSTVPMESVDPEIMRLVAATVPSEVIVKVPAPAKPMIGEAPTQIDPLLDNVDPGPETCTELLDPPKELM